MEINNQWLSKEEAAQYLRTDIQDIEAMLDAKQIPHSVLPGSGTILFSTSRLDRWLQNREVVTIDEQREQIPLESRKSLIERILERTDSKSVSRSRYTNLYVGQKVYAQLHEPGERRSRVFDGVCLAIPEASSDKNLPEISILDHVDVEALHGFWGANSDWLLGNGQRFTQDKA
ncbi:MAG: helix-turn-helix domain-containing protein, partial [Smithella sp.]|nr:helix-turn-helix domain-containing protein [Smithella sp.]